MTISGKVCPLCHMTLTDNDIAYICSACGTPHHAACWNENGSCATYQCQGTPFDSQFADSLDQSRVNEDNRKAGANFGSRSADAHFYGGQTNRTAFSFFTGAYKKYAVFAGRARRKEFWFSILFFFIITFIASYIDRVAGLTFSDERYGVLRSLFLIISILPLISVSVRRLHDIGKSGGYYFLGLLPLIGSIILLILYCQEGNSGANQYGEDPKEYNLIKHDW